jgi:hypothetical protein
MIAASSYLSFFTGAKCKLIVCFSDDHWRHSVRRFEGFVGDSGVDLTNVFLFVTHAKVS